MANATEEPTDQRGGANDYENDDFYRARSGVDNSDPKDSKPAGDATDPTAAQPIKADETSGVYDNTPGNSPSKQPGSGTKKALDPGELAEAEQAGGLGAAAGAKTTDSSALGAKALGKHENQIGSGFKKDDSKNFFQKISGVRRRTKAAVLMALATIVVTVFIAITSFLSFELINFKHFVTDKIGGTESHSYRLARGNLYSTQFFFDENGKYSGSKVGGVRRLMLENRQTKTMVSALEKNGYKIEFKNGKVVSLRKLDVRSDGGSTVYTSNKQLQSAWSIRQSGDLNGIMREVMPDKSDFWYNRATSNMYRRLGLTRSDIFREKVKEVTGLNSLNRKILSAEDKMKLALRRTLFGSTSSSSVTPGIDKTKEQATADDTKAAADQRAAAQQALGTNDAIQQASDIGNQDRIAQLADPTNDGEGTSVLKKFFGAFSLKDLFKSGESSLKVGDLLGSLNVLNTAQKACTVNTALRDVQVAARTMRAIQLAKFAMTVLTVADAVQNGKNVPTAEVSTMMTYLNSKDSNGKTYYASSGWRFWNKPSKANSHFASYDSSQRDQFSVGGGFTGTLGEIQGYTTKLGGGISCSVANNPFVSAFGFIAGGAVAFFSAGTSLTVQIGVGVTESFLVNFAVNIAVHILAPIIAGTVINGSEQGTAVGNAFTSGAETLTAANGASTGMRPLTNSEFAVAEAEVQADKKAEIKSMPIAQRLFSPNVDSSLTSVAAMNLNGINGSSLISAPFASLSKVFSFGGLFGSRAAADTTDTNGCPDTAFSDHNLAATPFCNPILGVPDSVLNNPAYAPDKIDDTINATEQNVDDYGSPIPGSSYANYINDCTADGSGQGPIDIIHTDKQGEDPNAYTSRCSNDLFNAYRLYMTAAQGENDALTGNVGDSGGSSTSSNSDGSGNTPVPTDCKATKPVNGSVNGSGDEYSQAQLARIFGEPGTATSHPAMDANLVNVDFLGHSVQVNKLAAPCLSAVAQQIQSEHVNYTISGVGCYRFDSNNGTSNIGLSSYHTYGAACDINPSTNPFVESGAVTAHDMPSQYVQAFYDHGFTWGGSWHQPKDYMHFEFNGIST